MTSGITFTLWVSLFFYLPWSVATTLPPVASLKSVDVVGEAYDLDTQTLLYSEYHEYEDPRHRVLYLDASGKVIADKTLDYSDGLLTPTFEKLVTGRETIAVKPVGSDVSIVKTPENSLKKSKKKLIRAKMPLVIDAGFDHFVRENWDALVGGETLEFYFPLPNRATLAKLEIVQSTCSYVTSDLCFNLQVSNWFLKMLVDPIELGYHAQDRKLMRYRGLSNIQDSDGNGLVVDIRYRHDTTSVAVNP